MTERSLLHLPAHRLRLWQRCLIKEEHSARIKTLEIALRAVNLGSNRGEGFIPRSKMVHGVFLGLVEQKFRVAMKLRRCDDEFLSLLPLTA